MVEGEGEEERKNWVEEDMMLILEVDVDSGRFRNWVARNLV